MQKTLLHRLFQSISMRWRPEDVARVILDDRGRRLPRRLRGKLTRAARHAGSSSMHDDFDAAVDLARQIDIAKALFPDVPAPKSAADPRRVRGYLDDLKVALGITGTNFLVDRHSRALRAELKIPFASHRAYNKRFRLVRRLEGKYTRWTRVREMKDLAQVGKTRLANRITWADFSMDADTACFVAWMTARLGLRSQFTWGRQQRAYDDIAKLLFEQLDGGANWKAVAMVHPAPEVVKRLRDVERGELLGTWFSIMERAAAVMRRLASTGLYDLRGMVVRLGNDSSTWNEAAGAFDKARDGRISTLHAMDAAAVLDELAPGKALRLMAADVVYMHRRWGRGGLEPDTEVWHDLPKPWDVVSGVARCTRDDIATACARNRVTGKGWIAPRPKRVAKFSPTPELVHGVTVASPALATALRRAGYFSGPSKGARETLSRPLTRTREGDHVVVS